MKSNIDFFSSKSYSTILLVFLLINVTQAMKVGKNREFMTLAELEQTDAEESTSSSEYSDPLYGTYISERPYVMGFDKQTAIDERDWSFHFIIFADKNYIYAWDPLARTRVRIIGT